jgi:hypothetical protein
MLKSNALNILATFAALALSILFLMRTAALPGGGTELANAAAARAAQATPFVIKSYPADVVIIEALPAK